MKYSFASQPGKKLPGSLRKCSPRWRALVSGFIMTKRNLCHQQKAWSRASQFCLLTAFFVNCSGIPRLSTCVKNLAHTDSEGILLGQAHQCFHGAWQAMRPFVCRPSWHSVCVVLRLMRTYVASTFLWFMPVIYLLVQHVEQVDIWQAMYMTWALKLCIPPELNHGMAVGLNLVRKRSIRLALMSDR